MVNVLKKGFVVDENLRLRVVPLQPLFIYYPFVGSHTGVTIDDAPICDGIPLFCQISVVVPMLDLGYVVSIGGTPILFYSLSAPQLF